MAQLDEFYQKLPYTLEEPQTTPEYVVFGTGLQQTLIAAYKSKMENKQGLIIDTSKTYGSSLKTVTFKEFNQLNKQINKQKMYQFITPAVYNQSNNKFYEWSVQTKKHRGYSIDIEPNFFLASSNTCECLKQADMDKYMDFHLVNSILHYEGNQMKSVPLSKGRIFQSKDLSLLQKKNLLSTLHKLVKIYQRFFKLQEDLNSTQQFDKDTITVDQNLYAEFEANIKESYLPFISKLVKKNKKLLNFLSYIICNYQYNYERPIPQYAKEYYSLRSFIQKFGRFIKSCGVYGQIPYLYVDNGIGDVPQAFSRIASIYGSVYILHPRVQISSIKKDTQNDTFVIQTNLSPEKPIVTKEVYFGPTQLEVRKLQQQFYEQKLLRVFVLSQKNPKQPKCPAICFINDFPEFAHPIYLFIFDGNTHSCPNQYTIHQFETVLQEESTELLQARGEKLLKLLQNIYGETFKESIKYYAMYVRTRRYPKKNTQKNNSFGIGLNDTMGIDLDQHFAQFMNVIGHQQNYFKKDNPNQIEEQVQVYLQEQANQIFKKMDELNIKQQIKKESAEVKAEQVKSLFQKTESQETK